MAQKGKKEKGSGAAAAVELPPERDVIPGKITESQWQEWCEAEESSEVAGEVVRGLVDLAFYLGRDHCLEEQAFSHTVQAARDSLLQIIEWEFLQRDEGERDPGNDPSWLEDNEPQCSVIDSWARGIVPEVSGPPDHEDIDGLPTPTTTAYYLDHQVPLPDERETSTANSIPLRDNSRQPTRESTVASSSYSTAITTTTSTRGEPQVTRQPLNQKVTRARPKARRPGARLVVLTQPQSTQDPQTPSPHPAELVASPVGSCTPTSSPVPPSSPPHLLPYNMKPAQLRWQKDVTYDSSGRIVDMLRLNPTSFPSHRVRPRVTVSDPTPVQSRRPTHISSKDSTSAFCNKNNPSFNKPTEIVGDRDIAETGRGRRGAPAKRGGGAVRREGVRRREGGKGGHGERSAVARTVARENSGRFPEALTLPALVDTIDLSTGVSLREGGRSVRGPPSPHRPPHFLLPHTTLHSLTLPHPSLPTSTRDTVS